jgi:hypothetical protein
MIDIGYIRRLNNYDTDAMIRLLELNEDRLYHWLVLGSLSVVREDLDRSIEFVQALRDLIRKENPDFISPHEALLPF